MTQSRTRITELTRAGMVLAVIIVLAFFPGIPVGILPAPIVLQNAGIMLAGPWSWFVSLSWWPLGCHF